MKYYQIHLIYGPEASDKLYYSGEYIKKLYSAKEIAEQEAVILIEERRKNTYTYTPKRCEILELEVVK
ncbi:MAG: hypothetical protein ACI4SM_03205 [Candidatus Gastranaerophilaceae bacterium]